VAVKGVPNEEKIKQSAEYGKKSIFYYREILTQLLEDKECDKNEQYFRSILNSKINIAKNMSKLLSPDRKQRV
jgi:hypothetical protein